MDPSLAEYKERTEEGWTKMLDSLAALFERPHLASHIPD